MTVFTNNYISLSDVDDVVSRDSVPTGAVFTYTGGTGRNYCALGTIHRNIDERWKNFSASASSHIAPV